MALSKAEGMLTRPLDSGFRRNDVAIPMSFRRKPESSSLKISYCIYEMGVLGDLQRQHIAISLLIILDTHEMNDLKRKEGDH